MDTTIANANALQRMLLQGFLPGRPAKLAPWDVERVPAPPDAVDTLPMLYRSEAFAEDLLDSHPSAAG